MSRDEIEAFFEAFPLIPLWMLLQEQHSLPSGTKKGKGMLLSIDISLATRYFSGKFPEFLRVGEVRVNCLNATYVIFIWEDVKNRELAISQRIILTACWDEVWMLHLVSFSWLKKPVRLTHQGLVTSYISANQFSERVEWRRKQRREWRVAGYYSGSRWSPICCRHMQKPP